MYTITTRKARSKDSKLSVMVDQIEELSIPPILRIARTDKDVKFRKHLDDRLYDDNDKQRLLNYMVFLHSKAQEIGSIELVCNCKFNYHAKVIKSFLEDNRETFSSLVPYLFPKVSNDDLEASETVSNDTSSDDSDVPESVRGRLSSKDWNQIQELMKQHNNQSNVEDAELIETEKLIQVESEDDVDM